MEENKNLLRDELTGAVIGIARACENNPKTEQTDRILMEGLIASGREDISNEELTDMIEHMHTEKYTIVPDCKVCMNPCGNTDDYKMRGIYEASQPICAIKLSILTKVRDLAGYSLGLLSNGQSDQEIFGFFYKVLAMVGYEFPEEDLKTLEEETDQMILRCKELI